MGIHDLGRSPIDLAIRCRGRIDTTTSFQLLPDQWSILTIVQHLHETSCIRPSFSDPSETFPIFGLCTIEDASGRCASNIDWGHAWSGFQSFLVLAQSILCCSNGTLRQCVTVCVMHDTVHEVASFHIGIWVLTKTMAWIVAGDTRRSLYLALAALIVVTMNLARRVAGTDGTGLIDILH